MPQRAHVKTGHSFGIRVPEIRSLGYHDLHHYAGCTFRAASACGRQRGSSKLMPWVERGRNWDSMGLVAFISLDTAIPSPKLTWKLIRAL